MKKINFIICLAVLIAIFFTGCHKDPPVEQEVDPVANFTFNKDTFEAGDVVHCTNTSTNAYSYKWTTPDGSIFTTQNIDYTLDNDLFYLTTKTLFKLQVTSIDGDKLDTISKNIIYKETILPSDYFSVNGNVFKPISKRSGQSSGMYWLISAFDEYVGKCYNGLLVSFNDTVPPSVGSYGLQSNPTIIPPGQAFVQIGAPAGVECSGVNLLRSTGGQVDVSYTSNGKLRVVFNNVPATGGALISGDITDH